MHRGDAPQPAWTAVNAEVDRALAPLEQRLADKAEHQDGGSKKVPNGDTAEAAQGKPDQAVSEVKRAAEETHGSSTVQDLPAAQDAETEAPPAESPAKANNAGKIDINHARAAELDALPGIGASKAAAIVADRQKNGLFQHVEDLLRVKGIGPKLLEKMKSSIVLQP
ncbi:helix-hairpin-helix domain-containing protein [Paenibacillus sp. R14(2021)]|uniref:helix-hairpin-helix domain-containing protein n=1 Tax=Paenibacillus sp. R14(2021) TaxID=2859228 RepID=UPI001C614229|nr:helix-hairpin-helix domain-containing protein [Paenibacillus sp. R14(2021)]